MQISSRFTLAVHILTCIKIFGDSNKITSEFLAASTNVNPVIVRKIIGQLKKAGIVKVARGSGGAVLAKPENDITFLDILFDVENADLGRYDDELGETLGEALLRPTVIYVKPVLRCIEAADVKGVSHITGGGFYENVPRCIPDGLCARIDKAAVKTPAIFRLLQKKGGIDEHDMFNTFNMGVGMAVIVSPETADAALSALKAEGIDAYVCGEIVAGEEKVVLC